ncbi:MAG: hypothetical protein M3186_00680, partial [Actinomycetota bacterium]|nr:hypothetical protein [Actinomycetota bacterium]
PPPGLTTLVKEGHLDQAPSGWRRGRRSGPLTGVPHFTRAVTRSLARCRPRYTDAVTNRTELAIPDYDHLPEGSLAHRIRSLPVDDLQRLLDYEQEHGNRLPVVHLLDQRIQALQSGNATPSPGDPGAEQPEHPPPPASGSPGNPATSPANNQPLRHGVAGQTPNRNIRGR